MARRVGMLNDTGDASAGLHSPLGTLLSKVSQKSHIRDASGKSEGKAGSEGEYVCFLLL